jgi:preprotein translocase subunit Sec61beta
MTSDSTRPITREDLRTPRAAAWAGILFALLVGAIILLTLLSIPPAPPYEIGWLTENAARVQLAVSLAPFAGIAFLWFVGVIRSHLGELEDQFFSSVFFGSALLFLGAFFVWTTIIAAVLASATADPDAWSNTGAYIFGRTMIKVMGGVVTLRMAGVFMFSSSAIWLRTKIMPRWLVFISIGLALLLLIGGGALRPLRLVFPVWIFVVSLFVMRTDRLADEGEEGDGGDSEDSDGGEDDG